MTFQNPLEPPANFNLQLYNDLIDSTIEIAESSWELAFLSPEAAECVAFLVAAFRLNSKAFLELDIEAAASCWDLTAREAFAAAAGALAIHDPQPVHHVHTAIRRLSAILPREPVGVVA